MSCDFSPATSPAISMANSTRYGPLTSNAIWTSAPNAGIPWSVDTESLRRRIRRSALSEHAISTSFAQQIIQATGP